MITWKTQLIKKQNKIKIEKWSNLIMLIITLFLYIFFIYKLINI